MLSVTLLLLIAAFATTIANALGRCPIWIPVILIVIVQLLTVVPVR
jgi:hypothetical protein